MKRMDIIVTLLRHAAARECGELAMFAAWLAESDITAPLCETDVGTIMEAVGLAMKKHARHEAEALIRHSKDAVMMDAIKAASAKQCRDLSVILGACADALGAVRGRSKAA